MKKTWIVLAMAAALCAACTDKKDAEKCVENTAICDGNGVRMICTNGAFIDVPCDNGQMCSKGACVSSRCVNEATKDNRSCAVDANGYPLNVVTYCNANGVFIEEPCDSNSSCVSQVIGTNIDGSSKFTAACVARSNNNGCEEGTIRCALDDTKKARQVCQNGEWVASEACDSKTHCSLGNCIECDDEAVECDGNVAKVCVNGKWTERAECTGDNICRNGKCVNKNACSKEGAKQCAADNIALQECVENDQGKLAWTTTSVCDSAKESCHDAKCYDKDILWNGDACSADYSVCIDGKAHTCKSGTVVVSRCSNGCDAEGKACASSGGSSGGASCDVYDCTAQYGSQCQAQFGVSTAICDDEGAYCMEHLSNLDSQCGSGETAWDNDGDPICLVVGSSEACLGGSTGGATCEFYDCSAQYASQCQAQFGTNSALCNASQAFCTERITSADSTCANGKTAWDDGKGSAICLSVGSSAACLTGGGSAGGNYKVCDATCKVNVSGTQMGCAEACKSVYGSDECYMDDESIYCEDPTGGNGGGGSSDDTYFACGDPEIDAECQSRGQAAYCFSMAGSVYYSCGPTCSTVGSTTTLCDADSSGSYTYPAICAQIGSNKVYVDNAQEMDDYVDCSSTCNDTGTACK